MKLSILIPVYNAEKTIGHLCGELLERYALLHDLEIILVNDGSTDRTDEICRSLHAVHPAIVTYVKLSRNFGEHNALMAGLHQVTGDYCVMMDDDFQNPPKEIAKLVREILTGYDVVYASYRSKKDSLFRNAGSRLHNLLATLILKKPAGLYLASFKIINRFVVEELKKYAGPDPYIDGIILRTTTNIGTVEVEHHTRRQGSSGYSLGKLLSLGGNMIVNFSLYPLRLIGIVGAVMMLIGIFQGVDTLYDLFSSRQDPTELEELSSSMALFRGFILFSVSIVGEYVGRIYLSLSKDPQFIVRTALRASKAEQALTEMDVHAREACNAKR